MGSFLVDEVNKIQALKMLHCYFLVITKNRRKKKPEYFVNIREKSA